MAWALFQYLLNKSFVIYLARKKEVNYETPYIEKLMQG